jgi:hypothetical protein
MKFQNFHKRFFNCENGAFSKVTEREYFDSQITVTKDEKSIVVGYFGKVNILNGNKASDPDLALKDFLLYPKMLPISLNLVFPKPAKSELRLYLSSKRGFKPKGGHVWFVYIDENEQIVIGTMSESVWNSLGFEMKT